jgi:hypothetical protein
MHPPRRLHLHMMRPRRQRHRRRRLPHKFPIHKNLRPRRLRRNRHHPSPATSPTRIQIPSLRSRMQNRPSPLATNLMRHHRHRLQAQSKMIRPQNKILPMMFPSNPDPIKRPLSNRHLLHHVPTLHHPQNHPMFQPRSKHRMRLVKIPARILRRERRSPHHHPINLHLSPSRRTSNRKRLSHSQGRPDRQPNKNRQAPQPPTNRQIPHTRNLEGGSPAHCHPNEPPSMRKTTHTHVPHPPLDPLLLAPQSNHPNRTWPSS